MNGPTGADDRADGTTDDSTTDSTTDDSTTEAGGGGPVTGSTTQWHARAEDLAAYAAGRLTEVAAASVEAHLLRCPACRTTLADDASAATDTDRRWAALAEAIDRPSRSAAERWGLLPHAAATAVRVTLAVPTMRAAWLAALALVVLLPLLAQAVAGIGMLTAMLALAPAAPVAAVALAYQPSVDPAGELAGATPRTGLRLVAVRALGVAVPAVPLGLAVGLASGIAWTHALAWVLPGLALAALVLAVGTTRWDPAPVAAVAAGAWALAVGLPTPVWHVAARAVTGTVSGPTVQLLSLAVAVAAAAVAVLRRDALSYRRTR